MVSHSGDTKSAVLRWITFCERYTLGPGSVGFLANELASCKPQAKGSAGCVGAGVRQENICPRSIAAAW